MSSGTKAGEEKAARDGWRAVTLYIATAAGVVLCFLFLHTLLFAVTGAVTLAIVTVAPFQWLRRRLSSSAAALVMLTAISVALLVPAFFLIRDVAGEVMALVHFVQTGGANDALHTIAAQHPKIGGALQRATDALAPDNGGKQVAAHVAAWLGYAVGGFFKGITQAVLMLFLLFFLYRDQDAAVKKLKQLVPLRTEETENFLRQLSDVAHAIFAGRLLIAALQGVLAGLAYWLLGVPGALLWGTVTAVFCLIPSFGAFLAWVPIAIYLGLSGSWTKAAILAVWGSLVISTLDNFLYPILVGRRTNLHTAVVFVSIFGGLALFGVSGFVLGPVLAAATMLLLQIWKSRLDESAP